MPIKRGAWSHWPAGLETESIVQRTEREGTVVTAHLEWEIWG